MFEPFKDARLDVVVEAAAVDAVGVVDVDGLDLQAFEAVFKVLSPQAVVVAEIVVLCGDGDLVAPAFEGFADNTLAVFCAVEDCGVDVVDAAFEGAMDHGDGEVALDTIALHGEAHGAEAES